MRPFSILVGIVGFLAAVAPAPAGAQQQAGDAHSSWYFDLHPELTKAQFDQFTAELGPILRSPQLGDATTVDKGKVELSVQFANTSIDDSTPAWSNTMSHPVADHHLGPFMSFPRVAARFGVSDRVDIGVSGGIAPRANYGLVGIDTRIALLKQGATRPVSVTIRPSMNALFAPSEVWAGSASIDLTVSRAFGRVSPYAGVAAITSGAIARSGAVDLDPANAGRSLAYAGVSYRVRAVVLSAEVEGGDRTRYAFGIATRF